MMNKLMVGLAACAVIVMTGCGAKEKKEKPEAPAAAVEAPVDVAALAARDADPFRVVADFWREISATNVEAVVALSIDEGLDLTDGDVETRMKSRKYRDYVAVTSDLFAGYAFASAEMVKERSSQVRVSVVVTAPEGAADKVDLGLHKLNGRWRVDLFAAKDF